MNVWTCERTDVWTCERTDVWTCGRLLIREIVDLGDLATGHFLKGTTRFPFWTAGGPSGAGWSIEKAAKDRNAAVSRVRGDQPPRPSGPPAVQEGSFCCGSEKCTVANLQHPILTLHHNLFTVHRDLFILHHDLFVLQHQLLMLRRDFFTVHRRFFIPDRSCIKNSCLFPISTGNKAGLQRSFSRKMDVMTEKWCVHENANKPGRWQIGRSSIRPHIHTSTRPHIHTSTRHHPPHTGTSRRR